MGVVTVAGATVTLRSANAAHLPKRAAPNHATVKVSFYALAKSVFLNTNPKLMS